jgi:precorrin-6A/cobalt-precorrin-6A reductase
LTADSQESIVSRHEESRRGGIVAGVMRVLILGGTGDARRLASLATAAGFDVTSSLAGRTAHPTLPEGASRSGGFGGAEGLAAYLRDGRFECLVDATHPFADQITRNAARAAELAGVPRLLLDRPGWDAVPGDRWIRVSSAEEAAGRLPGLASRVFLTIGRQELAAFAHLQWIWFLYRMIDAPERGAPRPPGLLLLDRGPFPEHAERALMEQHRIEAVVTRNSGGEETYPKIAAARARGLTVVTIERPPIPPGEVVQTPAEALAWLQDRAAGVR